MNWLDLLIIILIGIFSLDGLRRGLLLQIFNILGFLTALLLALTFYSPVAELLITIFKIPKVVSNPLGFLTVWLLVEIIFFWVLNRYFEKFAKKYHHIKINKYLGIIPAALNAVLFLAFILLFIISLPIKPIYKQAVFDSKIAVPLVNTATQLEKPFNNIFGPITKQTLTFLTVKPEDKGTIDLKFTQKDITQDKESEKQMFILVNQQRNKTGAKALVWQDNLAAVARNYSTDMFARGYFSHFSPEGKDVGDRLETAGISYTYAGENLALAPSLSLAFAGLMGSEGHRRNILDPAFSKIGIGIVDGGIYGKMFTQIFTE
jgi:uncharacterized protein YkwD